MLENGICMHVCVCVSLMCICMLYVFVFMDVYVLYTVYSIKLQ